jgi:pimeloyl-ACP methyl ester carboxylesterase
MFKKGLFIFWLFVFVLPIAAQRQTFKTPQELADPNGAFADVNGVSLYYIAEGDPTNPAVILIHGFGGSTFTWRDNIQPIAEAGFYVVALDLPPFGLSDKNPDLDYSRSWMADQVAGLMDMLEIESATIVGHSMGGGVTAQFAVRHTAKVDQLVFVAGGIFDETARQTTTEEDENDSPLAILASIDPKSPFADTLLRNVLTPERFSDILISAYHRQEVVTAAVAAGYQRPLALEDWTGGFLAYIQAEETAPVTLAELAALDLRTLILWGEQDSWVEIVMGESMVAAFSNATFITYPDVGHLPMEENTAQFNEDLIAFLQGNR